MNARLVSLVVAPGLFVIATLAGCASKTDHGSPPPACTGSIDCAKGIGFTGGGGTNAGKSDATTDATTDGATDGASDGGADGDETGETSTDDASDAG
jgi:hypothetical protein